MSNRNARDGQGWPRVSGGDCARSVVHSRRDGQYVPMAGGDVYCPATRNGCLNVVGKGVAGTDGGGRQLQASRNGASACVCYRALQGACGDEGWPRPRNMPGVLKLRRSAVTLHKRLWTLWPAAAPAGFAGVCCCTCFPDAEARECYHSSPCPSMRCVGLLAGQTGWLAMDVEAAHHAVTTQRQVEDLSGGLGQGVGQHTQQPSPFRHTQALGRRLP